MDQPLLKIGELAQQASVPIATIKHYLREGLISATRKSGRTMCWYDPALVDRIRAIKELQETRYLPLSLIREAITNGDAAPDDLTAVQAISRALAKPGGRTRTRDELIENGVSPLELEWLGAAGLAVPSGADRVYSGDGLALLATLGAARNAGLSAEMLPFQILNEYLAALRALVEVELKLFRAGVLTRADRSDVDRLTTAATELSERLVVLLRRQLLLPTLQRLIEEERHARTTTKGHARGSRRARELQRKRGVERRRRQ